MCGCSNIAIATGNLFSDSHYKQAILDNLQNQFKVGHFTPILKQIKLKFNGKHTLTIYNIDSRY